MRYLQKNLLDVILVFTALFTLYELYELKLWLKSECITKNNPLWSGTNKNRDVSTGPLARPFTRSLAPLTCLLAPH